MTSYVEPQRDVELQNHYAGMVSRFGAYLIDLLVSGVVFSLLMWLTIAALEIVTGRTWTPSDHRAVMTVLYLVWMFFYFTATLAASGRTPGMAVLGLRVVRASGPVLDPGHAALRTLVFPLSFLLFGLGFLMGLVQRQHRCLHDLIANTAVVYSWDARTARLRSLARHPES